MISMISKKGNTFQCVHSCYIFITVFYIPSTLCNDNMDKQFSSNYTFGHMKNKIK